MQDQYAGELQKRCSISWMADDRVWSGLDKLVPLTDSELKCEKAAQGAETPQAEKPSRDDNCSAEKEMGSNRHDLSLSKKWDDRVLHHTGKSIGVYRARGDGSDFCERNTPINYLGQ
jgi:hypothetical protein